MNPIAKAAILRNGSIPESARPDARATNRARERKDHWGGSRSSGDPSHHDPVPAKPQVSGADEFSASTRSLGVAYGGARASIE
jgi:hypothetical protein